MHGEALEYLHSDIIVVEVWLLTWWGCRHCTTYSFDIFSTFLSFPVDSPLCLDTSSQWNTNRLFPRDLFKVVGC